MFCFVKCHTGFIFGLFPRCHQILFAVGRCSEAERSEASGNARPRTGRAFPISVAGILREYFSHLDSSSAFLAPARLTTGIPAKGIPAARASSFNPWTVFGLSVAQPEPRAPRGPNSNRCLSVGSGRQLACIRMSQNTAASI
jgi:hypothetical protein